ncbi:MAG: hypothetical protein O3B84_03310, partial [Chloroflexi bacterium]|nr:hypothetical protein [Chloroflexota bacterium]
MKLNRRLLVGGLIGVAFVAIAACSGETGPAGQRGAPGSAGAVGAAGAQGPQGESGATGAVGSTGVAGSAGTAGEQGPMGDRGPQGPAGFTVHTNAAVITAQHPDLGTILTDVRGHTLYLFTNDERNVSNCSGGCAEAWPPLTTIGDPIAGADVNGARLSTIERADGLRQVAYNGWPLYYYAPDAKPGDATGQD